MIKVYDRWEIQAWLIRIFKANTNKFKYLGIMASIRHFFYAIAWVVEGLLLAIHFAATRYHVSDSTGDDLDKLYEDTGQTLPEKGNKSRGRIKITKKEDAPESFILNTEHLKISISYDGAIYYYVPVTNEPVGVGTSGYAIVEYIAETLGTVYNYPSEGIFGGVGPELVVEHPHLVKACELLGNGMTGGTNDTFTDEEKRKQIWDYYDGLESGNDSALEKAGRDLPGIVHASAVEHYPTPGSGTVFVCDENGNSTQEMISGIESKIEGTESETGKRGFGIRYYYQGAYRVALQIGIILEMEPDADLDNYKQSIFDAARNVINLKGFSLFLTTKIVSDEIDQIEQVKRVKQINYYSLAFPRTMPGIYIVSFSGSGWNLDDGEILHYDSGAKTLYFSEGAGVPVGAGGEFTLKGAGDVQVIINVDPVLLPSSSNQENIIYREILDSVSGYLFEESEIVRVNNVEESVMVEE